jgi:hypothetical protein
MLMYQSIHACEVQEEFTRRRVADVICPDCGSKTGNADPFGLMKIENLMLLVIERGMQPNR